MTMNPTETIATRGSTALFEIAIGDTDAARTEIARLDPDDRDELADHVETLRRMLEQ